MNHNQLSSQTLEVTYPTAFNEEMLLLPIEQMSVDVAPLLIYAEANGFSPKDEYHITVIGARNVTEALRSQMEKMPEMEQDELITKLNSLIPILGTARLKTGCYHHVEKTYDYGDKPEVRESIIQEVEIEGIDEFYSRFSQITDIELGTPFPHLTLFTKGDGEDSSKGIGIASLEAFGGINHQPIES